MPKYRFFYHYRRSTEGMTVHFRGRCIPCKNVVCEVPTETRWSKQQPRLAMQGFAASADVRGDTVYLRP